MTITAKTIHARFLLFSELHSLEQFVIMTLLSANSPLTLQLFLDLNRLGSCIQFAEVRHAEEVGL